MLWVRTCCDAAGAAQELWAACAPKAFRFPHLGLLEFPRLSPLRAIRAHHADLALSGSAACCCLGLSYSLPSVGVSLLKWKWTNNLVPESAFRSLLPSGGRSPCFYHSSSNQRSSRSMALLGSWQRAASMEPEVLEMTECAGLCGQQHISLFLLRVKMFVRRESRLNLKPCFSGAEARHCV